MRTLPRKDNAQRTQSESRTPADLNVSFMRNGCSERHTVTKSKDCDTTMQLRSQYHSRIFESSAVNPYVKRLRGSCVRQLPMQRVILSMFCASQSEDGTDTSLYHAPPLRAFPLHALRRLRRPRWIAMSLRVPCFPTGKNTRPGARFCLFDLLYQWYSGY